MLTFEEIRGKSLGNNDWGNPIYAPGLIEKYLPGEHDYSSEEGEGVFLANLCVYLLLKDGGAPFSAFGDENSVIFLEHFLFAMCPKDTFFKKMSQVASDEDKVRVILDEIKTIRKDARFHDFYVNGYGCLRQSPTEEKIRYCQQLALVLKQKSFGIGGIMDFLDEVSASADRAPLPTPSDVAIFTKRKEAADAAAARVTKPVSSKGQPSDRSSALLALSNLLTVYWGRLINKEKEYQQYIGRAHSFVTRVKAFIYEIFRFRVKSRMDKDLPAINALYSATESKDSSVRGALSKTLSPHLSTLRHGELGKELRTFVKAGKADAIVGGKPVRTVRAFVAALQGKDEPTPHSRFGIFAKKLDTTGRTSGAEQSVQASSRMTR